MYLEGQADCEEDDVDEHTAETNEHQCFTAGSFDDQQRNDGHQNVHATHAQSGVLRSDGVEASLIEDVGGEVDDGVDTRQLLGQHHHNGNDKRRAERLVGQHLLQRSLGHQFHGLVLGTHLVHLVVHLQRPTQPSQSCI